MSRDYRYSGRCRNERIISLDRHIQSSFITALSSSFSCREGAGGRHFFPIELNLSLTR
jgi:hypothetical protein